MKALALAAPIVALITVPAAITPAYAQGAAGTMYLRGSFGFATEALRDWRGAVDRRRASFASAGQYPTWDNIGTGLMGGVEGGFMLTDLISVGLGVTRQKGVSDNTYVNPASTTSEKFELSMVGLTANVSIWPPGSQGLFVGANAGIGFGSARSDYRVGSPAGGGIMQGDWSGQGFVGGVFVGWEQTFSGRGIGFFKTSYQVARLGAFDGRLTNSQDGTTTGPPGDSAGPYDNDFSGFGLVAGFGVRLGPMPEPDVPNDRNARP